MRIQRLDLTRYGVFTDFSIPFGPRTEGPDLHIIYGPNEAGKSTTFSALLDLLYGMEKQSRYNFKHTYQSMQIGGLVEINGVAQPFVRLKRDTNSLLDEMGNPMPDGTILAELGGIDRQAFKTMFSLDDDTLEKGGDDILDSKGDLGQLLFSASSGLSALSKSLVDIREDCDAFYKSSGRSHELSQLKKDLDRLKTERDQQDTVASVYARLVADRNRLQAQYDDISYGLASSQTRLKLLQTLVSAHPRFRALRSIQGDIEPLRSIVAAPASWDALAQDIRMKMVEFAKEIELKDEAVERAAAAFESVVVDEAVLGFGDEIDALAPLRARYDGTVDDLPECKGERLTVQGAIDAILSRLGQSGQEDAAALLLPPMIRSQIDELMVQRATFDTRLTAAKDELDIATRELAELISGEDEGERGKDEPLAENIRLQVAAAAEAYRNSNHASEMRSAESDQQDRNVLLASQLNGLAPWTGKAENLADLKVPDAWTVERWSAAAKGATSRYEQLVQDIDQLVQSQAERVAELDVYRRDDGLLSDQEALALRKARDQAWDIHKEVLDIDTAGIFQEAMHRDDAASARRFVKVTELAQVTTLTAQMAVADAKLTAARAKFSSVESELSSLREGVATAIAVIDESLVSQLTIEQLSTWLTLREAALSTFAAINRAVDRHNVAAADEKQLNNALRAALTAAGATIEGEGRGEHLLVLSSQRLQDDLAVRTLQGRREQLQRSLQIRTRAHETAVQALREWEEHWEVLCGACWLASSSTIPSVSLVRNILKEIDALPQPLTERNALDDRIRAMELAQQTYANAVSDLASKIDILLSPDIPSTGGAIIKRLADARRQAEELKKAVQTHQDLVRDRRKIDDAQSLLDQQAAEMRRHFEVETHAEVLEKLAQLAKRMDLEQLAQTYVLEILEALAVGDMAEAEAQLSDFDADAAKFEIETLAMEVENGQATARDIYASLRVATETVSAIGGDAEVAKLEAQRRTLFLQIEDKSRRWLRLRLGVLAAEQGLRLYRDQHRSSLMKRAATAFSIVSRGAYRNLTTQAKKDGEVLMAISKDNGSKLASELSKGTRFQLYLALRVAGYEEFVASRRSIPFIADDIMETFDDGRAEETFKVFADMARSGQVIYLTHHNHLVEIARTVCPSVTIHQL